MRKHVARCPATRRSTSRGRICEVAKEKEKEKERWSADRQNGQCVHVGISVGVVRRAPAFVAQMFRGFTVLELGLTSV